jgi:ketosteroid isomerase-like protein
MPALSHRFSCIVAAAAFVLATPSHAGAQSMAGEARTTHDAAAIRAQLDSMAAGWNRGDLHAYLSGYADSAVTRNSEGFVVGVAAAEKVMRDGYWKTGRPEQALHFEHLAIRQLAPDVAIATGEYALSGGGQANHTGWFTTVWKRMPAGWRCVHDHSSS